MLPTYCYKLLRKQVLMKRFKYLKLSHGIEFRCRIQYLKTKCTHYDTVGCDNMNSIVIQFCNILLLFSIESYGSHLTNQHVIDNSIVLMIIVFLFFICSILMFIFFLTRDTFSLPFHWQEYYYSWLFFFLEDFDPYYKIFLTCMLPLFIGE